jgi:hypothetical protein
LIHRVLDAIILDHAEEIRLALVKLEILSNEHIHKLLCDSSQNVRAAMAGQLLKKLGYLRRDKNRAGYRELYLEFAPQLDRNGRRSLVRGSHVSGLGRRSASDCVLVSL